MAAMKNIPKQNSYSLKAPTFEIVPFDEIFGTSRLPVICDVVFPVPEVVTGAGEVK